MTHSEELPLPQPKPDKEALKANVFEKACSGNTQLLPLFPYIGPGDIVPCSAAFESDGTSHKIGYFIHFNTVDEVAVNYGAGGTMRTGDTWVGTRTHGVGGDPGQPFFAVMTITQRNLEHGEQVEAHAFQCEKCNKELARHEWNVNAMLEKHAPMLPTTVGSLESALAWNESDERRHCKHCGHQNPPFPLAIWGWAQYVRLGRIAARSRKTLEEAVKQ